MKKIIIITIVAINIVLLASQLWLSFSRATDGSDLVTLKEQLDKLKSNNRELEAQIYNLSSLSNIQIRATAQNLSVATSQFVSTSNPLAQAAGMP